MSKSVQSHNFHVWKNWKSFLSKWSAVNKYLKSCIATKKELFVKVKVLWNEGRKNWCHLQSGQKQKSTRWDSSEIYLENIFFQFFSYLQNCDQLLQIEEPFKQMLVSTAANFQILACPSFQKTGKPCLAWSKEWHFVQRANESLPAAQWKRFCQPKKLHFWANTIKWLFRMDPDFNEKC